MNSPVKCLLSAAAGAIAMYLVMSPSRSLPEIGNTASAQEAKSSVKKQAAGPSEVASEVKLDDSNAMAYYANFVRVTATPEEMIMDFGFNPQPFASGEQLVKVSHRMAMNFFTAKRLLSALQRTIERHEATFGPIELDVRKRAKN